VKTEPKILLIDDDASIRKMYGDFLRSKGFEVREEASAVSGLDLLNQGEKFDLVITDIMMARMDGWEFLDAVRKELRLDELTLPVIIISAFESDTLEVKAFSKGANGSFVKGTSLSRLVRMVRIHTGQERSTYSDDT